MFFSFCAIIIALFIKSINEKTENTISIKEIQKIEDQYWKNIRKEG